MLLHIDHSVVPALRHFTINGELKTTQAGPVQKLCHRSYWCMMKKMCFGYCYLDVWASLYKVIYVNNLTLEAVFTFIC